MVHSTSGMLTPRQPFRFAHTLDTLSWFVPLRGEQKLEEHALTRALALHGQAIVWRLEQDTEQDSLHYTLFSEVTLDTSIIDATIEHISHFLSLHDNLEPLYTTAQDDSAFQRIVEQLHGYHQVKFPSAFENACWAILTQRNTGSNSRSMKDAITRQLGPKLEVEGQSYQAFPEAEALAALEPGEIARLIGHAPKAAFLSAVAEAFSRIDERWLRRLSLNEAERWLRSIHGIGSWSASFILIRGLGKMERLPVGDTKLVAAASQAYGRSLSWAELEQLGQRYGDQRGYWSHYVRMAM